MFTFVTLYTRNHSNIFFANLTYEKKAWGSTYSLLGLHKGKDNMENKTRRTTGHSSKSRRAGRPRLELDEDQILKLAQCGMTDEEMCNLLEISQSTLQDFRGIIQKGRANVSQSIKRTQLEVALKERDRTMLIWVGKQYAGQRDKKDVDHSGEIQSPQVVFYGSTDPKVWEEEEEQ